MQVKNYYLILGVTKNASQDEIKIAYRKLVKFWHPDVNPNPNAHERILEINEAYEIISNLEKRRVFDKLYHKIFEQSPVVSSTYQQEQQKKKEKSKDFDFESSNDKDFDNLNEWINEARETAREILKNGLKKVDRTLETGFYAAGKVGDFFSTLMAIAIIGSLLFGAISHLFNVFTGNSTGNILSIGISIIFLIVAGLAVYGLTIKNNE